MPEELRSTSAVKRNLTIWSVWTLLTATLMRPCAAAEIWLSGLDPYMRGLSDPGTPSDFLDLFGPNAPWTGAQKSVKVIKVSTQFVMRGEDGHLRTTFAGLQQRGIKLAVEALMLSGDGRCGQGIEGYAAPDAMAKLANRIRQLGGDLSYVAMDEPLWFGHHFAGKPTACHSSIRDLAGQVAEHVAAIRRVFPDVRIGDTEPVGGVAAPIDEWSAEILDWIHQYHTVTGVPLAFLHLDVQWRAPSWESRIAAISKQARAAGVPIGIVANGEPNSPDGKTWTESADRHLRAAVAAAGAPDYIIFQSWDKQPRRFLPETDDGTMTGLVRKYVSREGAR